ncbi:MAG TPA: carboxypeptidase-like regulatory domain-containing protein, partial [Actinopolymorphaceae bacterium]|nr:carboxypeptidase-like regulatory domain-containing protein [Actinopolymorphaceae bacterium]
DVASMAALGVGAGLLLPVLVLAAQSVSPPPDVGVVTAAAIYVRQLGACVGVGAFGALSATVAPQRAFSYAVPAMAVAAVLALLLQEQPLPGAGAVAVISLPGQKAGSDDAGASRSAASPSYDETSYDETSHERSGVKQGSRFDPTTHLQDDQDEHRKDIRVRVRQADGRPVPGVVLTLCDLAGSELGRSVALGDGVYVLAAPDTGAYLVIASVQGYHPRAQVIGVREPQTEMELDLFGESGTYGVVRSGTGDPVTGATVALADPLGEVVARASTGMDGAFALADLRPGAYTLAVSALGYRPTARAVRIPDTGRVRQDVELVGGGHLHGTIRGIAGNPLRDARVTLVDAWGRVARVTASGPSGHYRFAEVAEGDYTVVASMYPPAANRVHVAGGQQHQHDVELSYSDV